MLFFYLVALPVVACATFWALLFLPSPSTGKPPLRCAHPSLPMLCTLQKCMSLQGSA